MNKSLLLTTLALGSLACAPAIVPNPAHPVGMDAQFYESADVGRVTYKTVGIGADGSNAKMDSLKVAIDAAIKDKIANGPDEKKRYLGMREGFFASIDPHSFATEKKMLGSKRLDANRVTYTAMVEVHVANLRESLQAKGMVADDEDVADAIGNPSIVAVPSKSFRNPKLQTSAETRINEYLQERDFDVLNRTGISDLQEVVSQLGEIAGHDEDEAAQVALALGAEVYITYAATVQTQGSNMKVESQLRVYETTTGRALADATGYSPTRPMGQAQVAMSEAISDAANKVIGMMTKKWKKQAKKGKNFFFTWRGDFSSGAAKNQVFQQMKALGKAKNTLATDGTMQFIVKVKGDSSGLMFSLGSQVEGMGCRVATSRGAMAVISCEE